MKIYLATWMEDNQGVTLTKQSVIHRLLSYFFLKDADNVLEEYVKTGIIKKIPK